MRKLRDRKLTCLLLAAALLGTPLCGDLKAEGAETPGSPNVIGLFDEEREESGISASGNRAMSSHAGDRVPLSGASVTEFGYEAAEEVISEERPVWEGDSLPGTSYLDETASNTLSSSLDEENDGVSINSLSANFKGRTAFLTSRKIVLNAMKNRDYGETYLVFNVSGNYHIEGISDPGPGLTVTETPTSYNGFPAIRIGVSANEKATKGNYRLNLVPEDKFSGDRLKQLKLSIKVQSKYPSPAWTQKTITFNRGIKGEFALNTPTAEGVTIAPLNSDKYPSTIPAGVNVRLDNENTVRVSLGESVKKKSFKVVLWLLYSDYDNFKAVKKAFTVKIADKEQTVKMKKASGSKMDLLQREGTAFHYQPIIKNTGLVVRNVAFSRDSLSESYILRTVSDPDSQAIEDIYLSTVSDAALRTGGDTVNLTLTLQEPRQDAKTLTRAVSLKVRRNASGLKLKSMTGKKLIFSEELSDNKVVCYTDLIVQSPAYAAVDPHTITDISDSSKVPKGAFSTLWTVDPCGRALRARIIMDKSKVVAGKNYKLTYRMQALGAPDGKYGKITFSVKA
ncbi:MAG: hypothetical protein K5989_01785 [Lachnospiraceae bacterium]|nr:hypothetical protein [Lachnospiraceae bacterium]